METLEDLFKEQINELYSIEWQLTRILPVMSFFAKGDKLQMLFDTHLADTKQQKKRLEHICEKLGISPNPNSSKVTQQMVADVGMLIRDDLHNGVQDSALLSQSQRMEHYEIASYEAAVRYAKQLGEKHFANLLNKSLEEEYEADENLGSLGLHGKEASLTIT